MRPARPSAFGRLTIGTLSEHTGCHIETIRYYERIGLMPRTARTEGGTGCTAKIMSSAWGSSRGAESSASRSTKSAR